MAGLGDGEDTYALGKDGVVVRQDRLVLNGLIDHSDIGDVGSPKHSSQYGTQSMDFQDSPEHDIGIDRVRRRYIPARRHSILGTQGQDIHERDTIGRGIDRMQLARVPYLRVALEDDLLADQVLCHGARKRVCSRNYTAKRRRWGKEPGEVAPRDGTGDMMSSRQGIKDVGGDSDCPYIRENASLRREARMPISHGGDSFLGSGRGHRIDGIHG